MRRLIDIEDTLAPYVTLEIGWCLRACMALPRCVQEFCIFEKLDELRAAHLVGVERLTERAIVSEYPDKPLSIGLYDITELAQSRILLRQPRTTLLRVYARGCLCAL